MSRTLSLYPVNLPISEQEESIRQEFITAYTDDYGPFNASDNILLQLASVELIKAVRLQENELDTRRIITAARQHPIGTLTRLLETMDATRAARLRGKKPVDSDDETELREYFLSLSADSRKPKSIGLATGNRYSSLEEIPTNVIGEPR